MVFIICSVKCGLSTIKQWYGCTVGDTLTLIKLFNEFITGRLNHQSPLVNNNNVDFRTFVLICKHVQKGKRMQMNTGNQTGQNRTNTTNDTS